MEKAIVKKDGTVLSWTGDTVRFEINRSDILVKFKEDIKRKLERIYCRRKYYFEESDVDIAIAQGGIVTLTKQQLLAKVKNKMDE